MEGLNNIRNYKFTTPADVLEYVEYLMQDIAFDSLMPPEERDYRSIAINRTALDKMGIPF